MFPRTWIQAQISVLGLVVLQVGVSYYFLLYLHESGQSKVFSSRYWEGSLWKQIFISVSVTCSPSSSLPSNVIFQGRSGLFLSYHCSCQPHKLGDKGRAVRGECFIVPLFKGSFQVKAGESSTEIGIQHPARSTPPPPPANAPCSRGLHPTGDVTAPLRTMQSRLWDTREKMVGDRSMPAPRVSLRVGWSHILNFSGY